MSRGIEANDAILYLTEEETRTACEGVDAVGVVRGALIRHTQGEVVLPPEAYLGWSNLVGASSRTINMPALIRGEQTLVGTKVINASLDNESRGLPRASGLTMLFDPASARIVSVMAAAHISALRTAAVTVATAQALLRTGASTATVIGAGVIAEAHLRLFADRLPGMTDITIFDQKPERAAALCARLEAVMAGHGIRVGLAQTAREAVESADLVVPCTTTTTSYIARRWLVAGCVVVNVSLDDLEEEALLTADGLFVDGWDLIADDDHRLLGKLGRAGRILGPRAAGGEDNGAVRRVDGELGEVFAGYHPGRRGPDEVIVVNPFGMAIEDVALAGAVYEAAVGLGLGVWLPR